MSYQIREFNVNDQIAQLSGSDIEKNQDSYSPSSINSVVSRYGSYLNTHEYIYALTDNNNKILWGVKNDGTIEWGTGIPTPVKEYITEIDVSNKEQIERINNLVQQLTEDVSLLTDTFTIISNEQYVYLILDKDGKILFFVDREGNTSLNIKYNDEFDSNSNKYPYIQMLLDNEHKKVISYRQPDGILVEPAGIDTEYIRIKNIDLSDTAKEQIIDLLSENINDNSTNTVDTIYEKQNLPNYGTVNIKSETFHLTYDSRVQSLDDVVIIQDFEDTTINATNRMTLFHYYIKSTLTDNGDGTYSINSNSVRLIHYASGKVKYNEDKGIYEAKETIRKVNGVCYYADTLGLKATVRQVVLDGYSVEAPEDSTLSNNQVKQIKVQVTPPLTGPVYIKSWTIEDWDFNAVDGTDIGKKYEHNCIVDIDFGHYYSKKNATIGIKHQGNSTMNYRKRNLRFTFYKDNTYDKKDKIKIGEMIRQSGYNLKAGYTDLTRIKEPLLYKIFNQIWIHRPLNDRFQWDNEINGYYHGATGNIKCFPITVNTNDEFFGMYMFGLKKDEKNYMLDGSEESGIFVSGAHNTSNDWKINDVTDDYIKYHYDLEMQDEWFDSDLTCLKNFHNFINNQLYEDKNHNYYAIGNITEIDGSFYVTETLSNGLVSDESIKVELVEFNRMNIPNWLDLHGFMDYFICMQVFVMNDNGHNNMAVYFGPDKKKFYPFFYDVDNSIQYTGSYTYNCDIIEKSLSPDMSIYSNLFDIYKDEFINRYIELRKTYLNIENIKQIYNDLNKSIPETIIQQEIDMWQQNISIKSFEDRIKFLEKRFKYLDEEYFKI